MENGGPLGCRFGLAKGRVVLPKLPGSVASSDNISRVLFDNAV